ncbi:hypothetical protein [Synechococcus sp. M16CYN]|uniref:hypothetical protein n=1 Tax=Synechococcus sp. M16CYN TaxID=3103139 RepID=UPI003340F207
MSQPLIRMFLDATTVRSTSVLLAVPLNKILKMYDASLGIGERWEFFEKCYLPLQEEVLSTMSRRGTASPSYPLRQNLLQLNREIGFKLGFPSVCDAT